MPKKSLLKKIEENPKYRVIVIIAVFLGIITVLVSAILFLNKYYKQQEIVYRPIVFEPSTIPLLCDGRVHFTDVFVKNRVSEKYKNIIAQAFINSTEFKSNDWFIDYTAYDKFLNEKRPLYPLLHPIDLSCYNTNGLYKTMFFIDMWGNEEFQIRVSYQKSSCQPNQKIELYVESFEKGTSEFEIINDTQLYDFVPTYQKPKMPWILQLFEPHERK